MSVRKPPESVTIGGSSEASEGDSLKEACQGLLNAIDRRDASAVADALREIVSMVGSEPAPSDEQGE